MLELKREGWATFIENARDEITKLWDDLMLGEEEREDLRRLLMVCVSPL